MRILIVEDNVQITLNIYDYFSAKGHIIDCAHDGITGLHLAVTQKFDVIILDLMLPGIDGVELCRKLRSEARNNTPILMLTARDDLEAIVLGFNVGTDDYLAKPFELRELEVRLEALCRRAKTLSLDSRLIVADLEYNLDTQEVRRAGSLLRLTPSGLKLLKLLMQSSHRVVSRNELESVLWEDSPPDSDALRAHLFALRAVIDKNYDKTLLKTIHGLGYRLADFNEN